MSWYLHRCSTRGIAGTSYEEKDEGALALDPEGGGQFTGATLRPKVVISEGEEELARRLHEGTHRLCYVARSLNFPVLFRAHGRSRGCPSSMTLGPPGPHMPHQRSKGKGDRAPPGD